MKHICKAKRKKNELLHDINVKMNTTKPSTRMMMRSNGMCEVSVKGKERRKKKPLSLTCIHVLFVSSMSERAMKVEHRS
jgi:hypothetical protein